MSGATKRRLAIVAGISECLVYAEAKYCAFEMHGDPKYYVCPRTEFCCSFGCCVSPGFQIYHLWYYWVLVIIMFLVCSGGGWWYRYWLQGRYRAAASAIPSRGAGNSRSQGALRGGSACPARQASITYNSARNTVLLHRMWKAGPHRGGGSSPAYPGPPLAAAASSTHFQNTSVVLNDVNCPYYQLYGPPPSYETVIAQTRGKLSSPMSPERTRNLDVTSATGSSALSGLDLAPRCRSFYGNNSHPSHAGTAIPGIQDSAAISRYEQTPNVVEPGRQIDSHGGTPVFTPYATTYSGSSSGATPVHPAARQDTCVPLDYHGVPISPHDYHGDPAAIAPDTFRLYHSGNLERLPSYHGAARSTADPKSRIPNGTGLSARASVQEQRGASSLNGGDSHSSVPDLKIVTERHEFYGRKARTRSPDEERERNARYQHGGSLKFTRTRDEAHPAAVTYGSFRRGRNFLEIATGSTSRRGNGSGGEDPAINVKSTVDDRGEAIGDARESRICDDSRGGGNVAQGSSSGSMRIALPNGDNCSATLRRHGIKQQQQQQQRQQQKQKTNPSDNVILEPLNCAIKFEAGLIEPAAAAAAASASVEDTVNVEVTTRSRATTRGQEPKDKRRGRFTSPGATGTHGNDTASVVINNHESKHNKLDRSKSLD